MAAAVLSRTGSATATMPASTPSITTNIAVLPLARSGSARVSAAVITRPMSCIIAALPSATFLPPTTPCTPLPVTAANPTVSPASIPLAFAPATIASANGCSDPFSSAAANVRIVVSSTSASTTTSVNLGCPIVNVPVLSTISVSTPAIRSSASASLISTPACAPRPAAVVMEIGVAKPKAQGQAMIRTDTAAVIA